MNTGVSIGNKRIYDVDGTQITIIVTPISLKLLQYHSRVYGPSLELEKKPQRSVSSFLFPIIATQQTATKGHESMTTVPSTSVIRKHLIPEKDPISHRIGNTIIG